MKLLNITLLLASISLTSAKTLRGLATCEDKRGKFAIPELGKHQLKNCQYVRNEGMDLCKHSWIVGNRCPLTCGTCEGEEGHGHGHVDQHLQMTCEEDDDLYLEHIVEIEDNCQGIIGGTDSECPYLCLHPMSVLHLYYSVTCPDRQVDATFAAVDGTSKCHGDDHDHEELAQNGNDEVCIDFRGTFKVKQLDNETRNCQYVRNMDMNLCKDSWIVRNRCPLTCGECGVDNEEHEDVEDEKCKDRRKKFAIKQLEGKRKNCQYVREQNTELCGISWRVRNRCPKTCGEC